MKTINTNELSQMKRKGDEFSLINVLSPEHFQSAHIPESMNVPFESDDFVGAIKKHVRGKDDKLVVYCASTSCDLSPQAAKKLEDAGYTNIAKCNLPAE